MLIGENGSGKSCIFDLFGYTLNKETGKYYVKDNSKEINFRIEFNHNQFIIDTLINLAGKNSFYGRSSLRQMPKLTRTRSRNSLLDINEDFDRPLLYIDKDERFENDIDYLTNIILEEVFTNIGFDAKKLNDEYIKPINDALHRIFGTNQDISLSLYMLKPPMKDEFADIRFKKGNSEIHYDLLSNGEKAIVNLMFNLFVRNRVFKDTIYFIDELDLHLNTSLQYSLIKEITENWLPENCQLWTASHSLGFIQYATEVEYATILDFDQLNFDIPQTLFPKRKESLDIFDVAVPKEMIFKIFQNKKVIVCENQNDEYYNLIGIDGVVFIGIKNAREIFLTIKNDSKYFGIRDRDFLSDNEISKIKKAYPNYFILPYYNFENLIYHPDNIEELRLQGFNKLDYINDITLQKNEKYDNIISDIKLARNSYEEFKTSDLKDKNIDEIIKALKSKDFESFYKFFDMKKKFNRTSIEKLNISDKTLCKTNWFKNQITTLLK